MEKPQENVKYERKLAGRSTSLWSAHKVSYGSDLACTCLTHLATSLPCELHAPHKRQSHNRGEAHAASGLSDHAFALPPLIQD